MKTLTQEQIKEQMRMEILAEMKAEAEAQALLNAEVEAALAAEAAKKNQFTIALEEEESIVTGLKVTDIEKYKAGEKSNEVTSFVRRSLIVKALQQSHDLTSAVWYLNGNTFANLVNAIKMFTDRKSKFDHLIEEMTIDFDSANNCFKFAYVLNEKSITTSYRKFLNTTYSLDIPCLDDDSERHNTVNNHILKANYSPTDIAYEEERGDRIPTPKELLKNIKK